MADASFSLIFPMAGQGARFGYQFKPFLRLDDELFIEAAVRPFRKWLGRLSGIYFVYLREQESAYGVSRQLAESFGGLPFHAIILEKPTAGPAETMSKAVEQVGIRGPAIVCDCDHSVEIEPLVRRLDQSPPPDCILPLWSLAGEDVKSWGVAGLGEGDRILDIAEKKLPKRGEKFFGVIGCTWYRDIHDIATRAAANGYHNLSEAVAALIAEGRTVVGVPLEHAELFGDPNRLSQTIDVREQGLRPNPASA